MAAHALRVAGATRRFNTGAHAVTAFVDLDLDVHEGELLVLLGPSGCGKSTLLRAIAGLDHLNAGTVELAAEHEAGAGIVFQQPLLLPWLTVRENVMLGLRYQANRQAAIDHDVMQQTLVEFGLDELLHAYPDELSGGQAQRVALARTVVTNRRLVLLDEPFSALDPMTRRGLQEWLLRAQRHLGLSVLLVTHDIDEALRLGDRIALMSPSPGRIRRTWTLAAADRQDARRQELREELLEAYADIEVAGASPADPAPRRCNPTTPSLALTWKDES